MSWNMLCRSSMLLFLSVSLVRMFYYANSLFYTLNLLFLVVFSLFYATAMSFVDTLLALIFLIVYVGAMLIIVGYVCAVCPNIRFNPVSSPLFGGLLLLLPPLLFSGVNFSIFCRQSSFLPFFFTFYGFHVFIVILVFLFLVLLMVTSQYSSPLGPFRSIDV